MALAFFVFAAADTQAKFLTGNLNTPDSRKKGERLSGRQWSLLCMDGVFRAFMKTDPLGLMERSPPLRA
jgi:hypothetical protein